MSAKYPFNEVFEKFGGSIMKGLKSLDSDISEWVDDNFWDLVKED